MSVTAVTKENFESEVMNSSLPVLLDFWAAWCGPCRMLAPVVDEIADERSASLKVGKINVDEQPELASRFGISSIPTLILIENGQIKNTLIGYREKDAILSVL